MEQGPQQSFTHRGRAVGMVTSVFSVYSWPFLMHVLQFFFNCLTFLHNLLE